MFERVRNFYGKICVIALVAVSAAIMVQMSYVFVNVAGRYLFNRPAAGAMEASAETMIYIVYLSLAYIQLTDSHIRIDFIFSHIGAKAKGVIDILAYLLGAVFFSFVVWFSFPAALHSLRIGEVSWGSVAFPIYPQKFLISLGSFMMAIQLLLDLIHSVSRLIKSAGVDEAPKLKAEAI